jgi:serine/threonine-protein kinase HipA
MHFLAPPTMDCHIEIFHEGQWLEAAQASFSDVVRSGFRANDCVFEYDLEYAFGDAPPPVSLAVPVDAHRHVLQAWPTFLYDLVPQGNGRRFLLDRLQLPDAQASDLPLLCAGAFNPIGRLRIREAVTYFAEHRERHGLAAEGFAFDELLARAPDFHEAVMAHGVLAAGGTGIQANQFRLLAAIRRVVNDPLEDTIEFVTPGIDAQRTQLLALRTS